MSFYSLDEVERERLRSHRLYHEFLRVPAMSAGLYVLPPGAADQQRPHAQDELYYVIRGAARFTFQRDDGEAEEREVSTGDVIFAKAQQEHRFHTITRELAVLVVFSPAET